MNGFINLDKTPGVSSARAVARVKPLLPPRTKIGHAGTLDPFASGVLVLLIGKATRWCERLMDQPKQYETTVKLGATTATDDPESPEQPFVPSQLSPAHGPSCIARPTSEQVAELLPRFTGSIQQRPPPFSAMKVGGRRAYDLARRGHTVELAPRTVQVYGIALLDYTWPLLRLRIDCGRGTYIRSLARDIGQALDVGGYVQQLRRTRVGDFGIDRAVTLELLTHDGVEPHLIPLGPDGP
jgi:tRNA pseudouridine55 synthase